MSARKASKTPAKSSEDDGAAAATKPGKTGDAEVDTLTGRMKSLQLSKQLNWGFDFTGPLPFFWWTYTFGGVRHLKMELLMNTQWPADIEPAVSASGDYLIVYSKIPNFFLNMGRLFAFYHDAVAGGPTFGEADSMIVEGVSATREIKEKLGAIGGAKQSVPIKLPFKVLKNFIDPYHPDGQQTGYALRSYFHENNPNGGQVKFTVLSVTMQDANSARVQAVLNHQDVAVDANLMQQYN